MGNNERLGKIHIITWEKQSETFVTREQWGVTLLLVKSLGHWDMQNQPEMVIKVELSIVILTPVSTITWFRIAVAQHICKTKS